MIHKEPVLVTGAAGFGGSSLTKALLDQGYNVTGLDVVAPTHAYLLRGQFSHPNFRYLWKSIQDIRPGDIEGHTVVAHMAAQPDTPLAFESPRYTAMQNIGGTVELLEAVRQAECVSKLIYAGSGNEIGRPLYLPIDEDHPLTPHNPYGFSKAAGELAMWAWYRAYGVPTIVLSTGVVIGPNMRREVFIFKWLWNALHGRPITVEGGQQTRDVTFIDDVVRAWILAIKALTKSRSSVRSFTWASDRKKPLRNWPSCAGTAQRLKSQSNTPATGPEKRGKERRSPTTRHKERWAILLRRLRQKPSL